MIIRQIPLWVAQTNAWVVAREAGGRAFVVDCPPDPGPVGEYVAELGLALEGIVLTHGHIDHTGGAGELHRTTGATAYVHPDDDFLTLHPEQQLKGLFGMVPAGEFSVPAHIEYVSDGEMLDLGGLKMEIRQTPGHTPGHICLYLEDQEILFSGDQLFAGSVGRTDLPGGSWNELMTSMRERVMNLPDDVRVLPGHGPETTIGRERLTNPFRGDWAV